MKPNENIEVAHLLKLSLYLGAFDFGGPVDDCWRFFGLPFLKDLPSAFLVDFLASFDDVPSKCGGGIVDSNASVTAF